MLTCGNGWRLRRYDDKGGFDMGLIGIGVGTAHMGSMKTGPHGEVLSVTPARWETDPAGGCVAIWPLNPGTAETYAPN